MQGLHPATARCAPDSLVSSTMYPHVVYEVGMLGGGTRYGWRDYLADALPLVCCGLAVLGGVSMQALSFRVAWLDDKGVSRVNRGYRYQYSSALGPFVVSLACFSFVYVRLAMPRVFLFLLEA